MNDDTG